MSRHQSSPPDGPSSQTGDTRLHLPQTSGSTTAQQNLNTYRGETEDTADDSGDGLSLADIAANLHKRADTKFARTRIGSQLSPRNADIFFLIGKTDTIGGLYQQEKEASSEGASGSHPHGSREIASLIPSHYIQRGNQNATGLSTRARNDLETIVRFRYPSGEASRIEVNRVVEDMVRQMLWMSPYPSYPTGWLSPETEDVIDGRGVADSVIKVSTHATENYGRLSGRGPSKQRKPLVDNNDLKWGFGEDGNDLEIALSILNIHGESLRNRAERYPTKSIEDIPSHLPTHCQIHPGAANRPLDQTWLSETLASVSRATEQLSGELITQQTIKDAIWDHAGLRVLVLSLGEEEECKAVPATSAAINPGRHQHRRSKATASKERPVSAHRKESNLTGFTGVGVASPSAYMGLSDCTYYPNSKEPVAWQGHVSAPSVSDQLLPGLPPQLQLPPSGPWFYEESDLYDRYTAQPSASRPPTQMNTVTTPWDARAANSSSGGDAIFTSRREVGVFVTDTTKGHDFARTGGFDSSWFTGGEAPASTQVDDAIQYSRAVVPFPDVRPESRMRPATSDTWGTGDAGGSAHPLSEERRKRGRSFGSTDHGGSPFAEPAIGTFLQSADPEIQSLAPNRRRAASDGTSRMFPNSSNPNLHSGNSYLTPGYARPPLVGSIDSLAAMSYPKLLFA